MKKFRKNNLIIIFLILLLTLFIINSELVIKSILSYTNLFMEKLFPASFIFFIISSLLIDYNFIEKISKLLHINGSIFYVVVMSMLSGFPSGSKYITDLLERELISTKIANYLIIFTHFPNPIFILGSVSSIFKDKTIPIFILISLIISNLLIGLFLYPKDKEKFKITKSESTNFSINLKKAIYGSIKTMILIYGTSVFFYLIITILNNYLNLSLYNYIFVNGLFDLTKGVFLTSLINNEVLRAIYIIIFISFGGISINMQVKSIIADTNIKYKNFILGRFFQIILSMSIFLLLLGINW